MSDAPSWMPAGTPQVGVVLCPGRDADGRGLRWLGEPLAMAGAAVATATYLDGSRYREDDADAAQVARDGLCAHLNAPVPWVVAGHSRGGTVALLAAAEQPGWEAVVALSATTSPEHLVRGLEHFAPSRYRLMVQSRGCTPDEDPGFYRRTSPLAHAADLRVPVLLVHGTLDLVVPHDHALWLRDALAREGHHEVELTLLEGTGHFFERTYEGYALDQVVTLVVDWLRGRGLLPRPQPLRRLPLRVQ